METSYKLVFKVEIESLFDASGKLSLAKMEHLAMVITTLQNAGFQTLLVSSGAIALGTAKMGLAGPPKELITKQAISAIGQADLIKYYQMFFDSFDQIVAQVLITKDVITNPLRNNNTKKTLNRLLQKGIIPIVNENDSVSIDDIILNDNYPLALIVAQLTHAHVIVVKENKEDLFRIIIRNNPKMIMVSEEGLFKLANNIKSGETIAEQINFDCKTRQPIQSSEKNNTKEESGLAYTSILVNGFPQVLIDS
ncbi:MAG: hypothetical protein EA361_19035 [Bacteroidetes bacterium]|nr:MAG: hypothetical protein EA361_19035 [Bacteroidota bacterium]